MKVQIYTRAGRTAENGVWALASELSWSEHYPNMPRFQVSSSVRVRARLNQRMNQYVEQQTNGSLSLFFYFKKNKVFFKKMTWANTKYHHLQFNFLM